MDLDTARTIGDPSADGFIARLVEEKGHPGFREMFTQMINRVEAPFPDWGEEAGRWLESERALPDFADFERIGRAQLLFRDHGPKIMVLLYYKALPLLYLNARGAEVLLKTGRLHRREPEWKNFTRRIAETAQFLLWLMPEGSLTGPGAPGRQITQRIRLIHAAVRHFVGHGEWDEAELGAPINQEDLLHTLLTFGVATVDGLRYDLGLPIGREAAEDYVHFWNVIGSLLGIRRELLPVDATAAAVRLEEILGRQAQSSVAGVKLTDALLKFASERLGGGKLAVAPGELVRYFIGTERAEQIGITALNGCLSRLLPHFLATLFRAGERLEERSSAQRNVLFDRLSQLTTSAMFHYFDRFGERRFEIPDPLREAWNLEAR